MCVRRIGIPPFFSNSKTMHVGATFYNEGSLYLVVNKGDKNMFIWGKIN